MKTAGADINAASALVEQAASDFMPKIQLEGRAATGYDVSGAHEWQNDLSARVSLRWNIYDGGIARNHVQEEMRRENEAKMVFDQTAREVEQAVRESWLRMKSQAELSRVYNEQLNSSSGLVDSYREQFTIGERSLLDLLDSQNTRFNVQILQETARYSVMFAEYRVLAASGTLIDFLGVQTHDAASAGTFSAFDLKSWEQFEPRTLEPLNLQKVGNY